MAKFWGIWDSMAKSMGIKAVYLWGFFAGVAVAIGIYIGWFWFWLLLIVGILFLGWDLLMSLFAEPPKRSGNPYESIDVGDFDDGD